MNIECSVSVSKDPKSPFLIATTLMCRGGHYSFPLIAPLYPWSLPYNAECKQGSIKYHFFGLCYDLTWDWTLVSLAISEHSNYYVNVWYISKVASSTIFLVFGMTWPRIEPWCPWPLANTLTIMPMSGICSAYIYMHFIGWMYRRETDYHQALLILCQFYPNTHTHIYIYIYIYKEVFGSHLLTHSSLLTFSSFVSPLPNNRQQKYVYICKDACQHIRKYM